MPVEAVEIEPVPTPLLPLPLPPLVALLALLVPLEPALPLALTSPPDELPVPADGASGGGDGGTSFGQSGYVTPPALVKPQNRQFWWTLPALQPRPPW